MIALQVASTPGLMIHNVMLTCWIAVSYTQTLPSCLNLWGSQSAIRREGGRKGGREEGREGCKKLRGQKRGKRMYRRGGQRGGKKKRRERREGKEQGRRKEIR